MCSYRLVLLYIFISYTSAQESHIGYKIFKKIYDQCTAQQEILKCFKIQALKIADRALYSKTFNVMNGITLVGDERIGKSFKRSWELNETKLQQLDEDEIDNLLAATANKFLETHRINFSIPKLVEESRKKKGGNKGGGGGHAALLWALAIKGSFLAMAYKGIAIMAGTALIVGKMALLISAILGLKKLVSSGHEKTTFEIVKHPKYSETHTHSSSYEDEGHYKRAWDPAELNDRQEKVYRAYISK